MKWARGEQKNEKWRLEVAKMVVDQKRGLGYGEDADEEEQSSDEGESATKKTKTASAMKTGKSVMKTGKCVQKTVCNRCGLATHQHASS